MGGWVEVELSEYYNAAERLSGLSSSHGVFQARAWGLMGGGDGLESRLTEGRRAAMRRMKAVALALGALEPAAGDVLARAFVPEPVPVLVSQAFGPLARVAPLTSAFRQAGEVWARHELAALRAAKAGARRAGTPVGLVTDDDGTSYVAGEVVSAEGCPSCEAPLPVVDGVPGRCRRELCRIDVHAGWADDPTAVTRMLERMSSAEPARVLLLARTHVRSQAKAMVVRACDLYVLARADTDPRFAEPADDRGNTVPRFTMADPDRRDGAPQPGLRSRPRIKMPPDEAGGG